MIDVKDRYKGRQKYDQINEIFRASACTVIPSESEQIHNYRLECLNEEARRYLISQMNQAIASPRDTYLDELHKMGIEGEWSAEEMADVLAERTYSSLLTLGLLGNTDILPPLLLSILERIEDKEGTGYGHKLKESLFLLRLLIGQEAVAGHISIEERLKQNLSALQQIPLDTRLRVGDLADWQIILRNSRKKVEALTEYAKSNRKPNFELDDKVWQLWDDLEKWVPPLEFEPLWCFPLFDRKVKLNETSLLKQSQAPVTPPHDSRNIEIWYDATDYVDPYEALWPYWKYLYSSLEDYWRLSSQAAMETVKWEASTTRVEKITTWQMPIHSVKRLNIKGAVDDFWIVVFPSEQLAEIPAISNAILLNLQLVAQQGGNTLKPVEFGNEKLTVELQIPRADNKFSKPSVPMPRGVIEQVACYILASTLPRYMEISYQLEERLFEAISRIKPHVPPFDVPEAVKRSSLEGFYTKNLEQQLFYELQEAANEVVWLREILAKYWHVLSG